MSVGKPGSALQEGRRPPQVADRTRNGGDDADVGERLARYQHRQPLQFSHRRPRTGAFRMQEQDERRPARHSDDGRLGWPLRNNVRGRLRIAIEAVSRNAVPACYRDHNPDKERGPNGQESLSLVRIGGDGSGIETLKQSLRRSRGM